MNPLRYNTGMSEALYAYLAGAIDADGSFTVRVDKTEVRNGRRRSPAYHEMISLKQVTPEVPHLLHETFGGSLYLQGPSVTKGRPLWTWHVSSAKASRAIVLLLPHLRIKTRQAKLLLELRMTKDDFANRPNRGTYTSVPAAEIEKREAIRAKIRALNKGH